MVLKNTTKKVKKRGSIYSSSCYGEMKYTCCLFRSSENNGILYYIHLNHPMREYPMREHPMREHPMREHPTYFDDELIKNSFIGRLRRPLVRQYNNNNIIIYNIQFLFWCVVYFLCKSFIRYQSSFLLYRSIGSWRCGVWRGGYGVWVFDMYSVYIGAPLLYSFSVVFPVV